MNKYEIMFIVKPDVEEEARNQVIGSLKDILTTNGGSVDKEDVWGLRELAYEIDDYTTGFYVVLDTTTTPDNIAEFNRISRINASVIRSMIIRK